MNIECVFFGPFRDTVGQKTLEYETDADTVGVLLAELRELYPDLRPIVEDGELIGKIAVTINGTHIHHLDGLQTPIEDGDVVRLTTAVYGG